MKTVTITLEIGRETCSKKLVVPSRYASTTDSIKQYAKKQYSSIINMGGTINIL
jgi:hypothetical protein